MATAGEGSYEGGGGGKFRKRPFRRPQTTPYDRPPNAIRNPRNGWLSRIVDPASRLITASAHRFFDSVFRKRLPPPPAPPLPEANQDSRDKLQEAVFTNSPGAQEQVIIEGDSPRNSPDGSGFTQLEQILKQKTFTRSEIDRLTSLLHSRTVDNPAGDEEKFSKLADSCDRQEQILNNPVQEMKTESLKFHEAVSIPVVSSRVLEDDVSSPAELAKAYMGSRPSKVSPSMLGLHSPAFREDSTLLSALSFPTKSPIMSIMPKSSSHVGGPENGLTTPRSRGRSALYSMARTPYSRVNPTSTIKGVASTVEVYGGPSSSQSAWEQNRFSGSKQGLLKRRSSVLDNDIGSVGPIRRIRQKPNLLSPKSFGSPMGGSTHSVTGTGVRSDITQPSLSLTEKPHALAEPKHKFSKALLENGDNCVPGTSFSHVPSQSSEMAEKILQQLDKLAPSPKGKSSELRLAVAREKSPAKLTPTMLHGQALKSLENVDSSKILENAQESNKLDNTPTVYLPDARECTLQKPDKVENGPTKFFDGSISVAKGTIISSKDIMHGVKTADTAAKNSVIHPPTQKKQAFMMSVDEDYPEMDDDVHSNGPASTPLSRSREQLDKPLVERKAETVAIESVKAEKPSVSSEGKCPSTIVFNKSSEAETSESHVLGEKNSAFTFPVAPISSMTVQPVVSAAPLSSKFDKVVPPKEPNAAPSMFSFDSKNVNMPPPITLSSSFPVVSESSGLTFGAFSDPKLESSSSSFTSFSAGATENVLKATKSSQGDDNNTQKAGDLFKKPDTAFSSPISSSTSTMAIFSFGAPANNSILHNGSLASGSSTFSSPSQFLGSSNVSDQSISNSSTLAAVNAATTTTTASATASGGSLSTSTAELLSFSAAPIFKFGSSLAPLTSTSPNLTTSSVESKDKESNTKHETSFGTLVSPFGGTSAANASTGSNIFGFNGSSSSTATNQSLGGTSSKIASTGSSIFGISASASTLTATDQSLVPTFGASTGSLFSAQTSASPAETGVASSSAQTIPVQFGIPASSPSFGLTGAASLNSGSSLFGSTPTAKPFGSSSGGLSSSASLSEASTSVSSSSGITSSVFGSNWQISKSPVFGSTFNSTPLSTGYSFGGTSASAAASSSAPMVFGSSTSASSGSVFSFGATAATPLPSFPSTQPVFGNSNSVFPFGSATGNNHDQMNMEDSMAEDTVQASTPSLPVLGGQQGIAPSPSTAFMFGSTPTAGANPFQFGSQQGAITSQNSSPFQASSSLDFNAGGSFSLGAGGGGDKANRRFVKVNKHTRRKK